MKSYSQISGEIGEFSDLPFWKKASVVDLAYVGYGLLIVTLVVVSYVLGSFNLLPYDPQDIDLNLMMAPPGTAGHILGTDFIGRDMLSRLIVGIQAYFLPGLLAVCIALLFGTVLGVLAGYREGKFNTGITYFTNLVDSFPRLVLILLVIAAFKPNIYYIMLVVGLTNVPVVSSLIKGKILFLKQKNFIEADTALGLPVRTIILKHILWHNCKTLLIIQATLGMGEAILMETSLSYLGFGVQEPTPSWGNMVQAGANYFMQGKFWPSTAPALAILFTILGFHLLGDGLNNILEKQKEGHMTTAPLLKIDDLRTYFYSRSKQAFIRSVDGVSVELARGETLGVVGESGSGKSITALSVMGLISGGPGVISGTIAFNTDRVQKNLFENLGDYVKLTRDNNRIMHVSKDIEGWEKNVDGLMTTVRGKEIAMIFQNPKSSLNPFTTVGTQITEAIKLHTSLKGDDEAKERALYWLDRVKIDSPRLRYDNYPYGLSGGMCQRAMIAMALACEPSLLIADEPTTGLDATIQSKIVDLLAELKSTIGTTTMLISHDISIISRLSDSVAVMYGGTIVEYGPVKKILATDFESKHPYTQALLESIPSEQNIKEQGYLHAIEGDVLDTINTPPGCRFYGRCGRVTDAIRAKCEFTEPDLREIASGHKVRCWLYFY